MTDKQTKIIEAVPSEVAAPGEQLAAVRLIEQAIAAGKSMEDLKVLHDLYQDMQAQAARANFDEALRAFQQKCPPISKNASTKQASSGGQGYGYNYASLDQIERTVRPLLTEVGLSYTFDMVLEDKGVNATCTLRGHGHEITGSFIAPVDTKGRMNSIQQHATSLSYAKRYALSNVLGISTADPDNDGYPLPPSIPMTPINDQQLANLEDLLDATNADKAKFKAFFRVKMLGDLPESEYGRAESMLKAKLK